MTSEGYEVEIERLHEFTLRLAQRLFLAAECLSRNAERKKKASETSSSPVVWIEGGVTSAIDSGR